ncbi:MAG: peptidylprolyl isomerase [Gammaproteobacteria bacterium]
MKISSGAVVSIHYTLTDDQGEVIDSSQGQDPLQYEHGSGNIIPGLEKALDGHASGDNVQVTVEPEEAYGQRNDEMIQTVSRETFANVDKVEPGMQFRVETEKGPMVVQVKEVMDESVILDFNHPLAGERLHFEVDVMDVNENEGEEDAPRIIT